MRKPHWTKTTEPRERLTLDRWPAVDRAAWNAALIPGDPFRPGGVAAKWAPISQRHVEHCYGRFLFWLTARGQLDPALTPGARINDERLNAYLEHLQATKSPFTVQGQIQALGSALRALEPAQDW